MKACHKNKTKTLLLGVSKILLAAYALIKRMFKRMFESFLLKSQKHVHGQASSSRPTAWFAPPDNAIVFTSCR